MSRKIVSDMLVAKIKASPIIAHDNGGVSLANPPDINRLAIFYAKEMLWPGGEEWCRGMIEDGDAAKLLLSLDGEKDG